MPPAVAQFFAGSIRLLSVLAVGFIEFTSRIYYVAALRVCKRGAGVSGCSQSIERIEYHVRGIMRWLSQTKNLAVLNSPVDISL